MEQQDIRGLIGHRFKCGQEIVFGSPLIAIWIAHDTADATDVQVAHPPQPPRHPGRWCCLEAPRGTPSGRGSPERRRPPALSRKMPETPRPPARYRPVCDSRGSRKGRRTKTPRREPEWRHPETMPKVLPPQVRQAADSDRWLLAPGDQRSGQGSSHDSEGRWHRPDKTAGDYAEAYRSGRWYGVAR